MRASLCWLSGVSRILLEELSAFAPSESFNLAALIQFGRSAALGSVERLPLIVLRCKPLPAVVIERFVDADALVHLRVFLRVASAPDMTFS